MSNVINLNKFRKQKQKRARERQAETNRRLHGRTKAERASDALQKKKLTNKVEQSRLEQGDQLEQSDQLEQGDQLEQLERVVDLDEPQT